MPQKSRGRPRRREKDAEAVVSLLRSEDWGLPYREVASKLRRPAESIRRALLLAAEATDYRAAREGEVRWNNILGGWYWWENEKRFTARLKEERGFLTREEQRFGVRASDYVNVNVKRILKWGRPFWWVKKVGRIQRALASRGIDLEDVEGLVLTMSRFLVQNRRPELMEALEMSFRLKHKWESQP